MKAMSLFQDCTYLGHSSESKDWIRRECLDQGYIPVIEYDKELGWVFHTIYPPDRTLVSRKKIADHFMQPQEDRHDEMALELRFMKYLQAQGHRVRRQVRCRAGVADIVTDDSVIEVEYYLSRAKLFEAVGQVLLYRQAINPSARAIIVAQAVERWAPVDVARELGIEVVIWTP